MIIIIWHFLNEIILAGNFDYLSAVQVHMMQHLVGAEASRKNRKSHQSNWLMNQPAQ